jgi:hypothetical protein
MRSTCAHNAAKLPHTQHTPLRPSPHPHPLFPTRLCMHATGVSSHWTLDFRTSGLQAFRPSGLQKTFNDRTPLGHVLPGSPRNPQRIPEHPLLHAEPVGRELISPHCISGTGIVAKQHLPAAAPLGSIRIPVNLLSPFDFPLVVLVSSVVIPAQLHVGPRRRCQVVTPFATPSVVPRVFRNTCMDIGMGSVGRSVRLMRVACPARLTSAVPAAPCTWTNLLASTLTCHKPLDWPSAALGAWSSHTSPVSTFSQVTG